jgi:hypothetical protein
MTGASVFGLQESSSPWADGGLDVSTWSRQLEKLSWQQGIWNFWRRPRRSGANRTDPRNVMPQWVMLLPNK